MRSDTRHQCVLPNVVVNELIVATVCCPKCGSSLDPDAGLCPHCAAAVAPPQVLPVPARPRAMVEASGPRASWLDNRWVVTGLLLTVGPAALPALWLSRGFSRRVKVIATVGFFLATAVAPMIAVWYFCDVRLRPLVDALSAAGHGR